MFDGTRIMSFLVKNQKLLTKYTEIWSKMKEMLGRKKFNNSPVFGDKY